MTDAERLQWLYDVESIKQLKHQYCAYCDESYDAAGIGSLFLEDGVWDGAQFGRYEGQAAIEEFFRGAPQIISFANHYATNPIIEVDGDRATGRWDLWCPMVNEPGSNACWLIAKYREQYARVGDRWFFKLLELDVRADSPYEDGFGKKRFK
jgi:hypothetical protein